jgi:hypothetical protein
VAQPRRYGFGRYGRSAWSHWIDEAFQTPFGGIVAASSLPLPRLAQDIALQVDALVARSGMAVDLRHYWAVVPACDVVWVTQPPPPYDCPPGEHQHG